jgi:hypothetical protein
VEHFQQLLSECERACSNASRKNLRILEYLTDIMEPRDTKTRNQGWPDPRQNLDVTKNSGKAVKHDFVGD